MVEVPDAYGAGRPVLTETLEKESSMSRNSKTCKDDRSTRFQEILDEFYTTCTLAQRTGLAPYTIRKWCWQKRIPSFKVGGRRLIRKGDVEDLLARCRDEADPEVKLGK